MKPLVTQLHQTGPLTCSDCRQWISEDNFETNEATEEVGNTVTTDTTETQISEESDTDEALATSAPHTPPRNLKQAATYILSKLQWRKATDGIVQHRRLTNPVTLHPNYYAQLEEVVDTRSTRMRLRPELLQFGKQNLAPEIYGKEFQNRIVHLLSQNATRLSTKKKDEKSNEDTATQTLATVDTTIPQLTISFSLHLSVV
jgi:hypothetical protein